MPKKLKFLIFISLLLTSLSSFSQSSTVYFFRPKSMFMANTECVMAVNDTAKIELKNGSYQALTTSATHIDIITGMNNSGLKKLDLEKGKNYYIEAEMQGPNAVKLTQKDEFTGKPFIERLQADEKAKELNTGKLEHIKVTSVQPLPQPKEDAAIIYLFRPFTVLGLSLIINISDGNIIYEMKNNSSYVISTDKKEITFQTLNEGSSISNTTLSLKPEKGKVYYVAVLRTGGAVVLSEAKEEYAKKEMKLQ